MEIRHILSLIGEQATDEEIDCMIQLCDNDGDGQVIL
jgi:Ca2+-binding EF-hand superfamily protein